MPLGLKAMKAPVWRSKRVVTPSARTAASTGPPTCGIAQELGLAQIVLLGDAAELGAVLVVVLVEPALVGKADVGAPAARLHRALVSVAAAAAHDVALAALGDVGPVDEDRGHSQRRRQQAAPRQSRPEAIRRRIMAAIVRRP